LLFAVFFEACATNCKINRPKSTSAYTFLCNDGKSFRRKAAGNLYDSVIGFVKLWSQYKVTKKLSQFYLIGEAPTDLYGFSADRKKMNV